LKHNFRLGFFEAFFVSLLFRSRLMSPLSKDETRRDSLFYTLMICLYTVIKTVFMYFYV